MVVLTACGPTLVDTEESGSTGTADEQAETATSPQTSDAPPPGGSTGNAPPATTAPSTTAAGTTATDTGVLDTGIASTSSGPFDEAADQYPTFRVLYDNYLEAGCAAFQNVCHRNGELPELSSVESYLDAFNAPCNEERSELNVYDRCEPPGDRIEFPIGELQGWSSEVGWVDVAKDGESVTISIRDTAPLVDGLQLGLIVTQSPTGPIETVIQANVFGNVLTIPPGLLSDDELMVLTEVVVGGDPNRDGQFGHDNPMFQLTPGSAEDSYLFARVSELIDDGGHPTRWVDGLEKRALGCWIEQVARPVPSVIDELIDYDSCTITGR